MGVYFSDKTRLMTVRLTDDMITKVDDIAEIFGVSRSCMVRLMLETAIDLVNVDRLRGSVQKELESSK